MFRSLLPAAGTVAGGLIGGPAGAAVGGNLGAVGSAFMGDPSTGEQESDFAQLQRFTPEQQMALSQMLQQGLGGLQQLPQAEFGPLRQQAMSQFQEDIVPGIAERFTAGGTGSQRSSAFQQAMGGAGAGLSERLAAMEQGFNERRRGSEMNRLMSMLKMGLQPQFGYARQPQRRGKDYYGELGGQFQNLAKSLLNEKILGKYSLFPQS
jgi:hypothetical protein